MKQLGKLRLKWLVILFALVFGLFFTNNCGLTVRPNGQIVEATGDGVSLRLEQDWQQLLSNHVTSEGTVDYRAIVEQPDELNTVYSQVAQLSPDSHPELFSSEEQRFSYWLNAYNIAVLRAVVEHYPIESVLAVKPFSPFSLIDKGGFFVGQKFIFGSKTTNLYDLEKKLIRKRFPDPRLHFALNCASKGCPQLPREAFQAAKLEEQLERETRKFMNSERAYQIDHEKSQVRVSSIFDWYQKDFVDFLAKEGEPEGTVLDYMERYLDEDHLQEFREARQQGYAQEFLEYDWSLNDSHPKAAGS